MAKNAQANYKLDETGSDAMNVVVIAATDAGVFSFDRYFVEK